MDDLVIYFASKNPKIAMVFFAVTILRAINKTVFTLWRKFVLCTPSKNDDLFLQEIEYSKKYKLFCWFLDLFTSIKIGPQK